jgi:H+/Cl- antiporter ClcA
MTQPVPRAFRPWIILSLIILVGSLVLLAVDVTAGFVYFSEVSNPLWVTVLGVFAILGIVTGFAGFFLLMLIAGWTAWRESRRVQVLPPS